MKLNRSSIVLITALLVLSLAGCVRTIPGVQAPPTAVGATGATGANGTTEPQAVTSPGATEDVLSQIYLFATQTAIAAGGGGTGQPPAQGTPAPGVTANPGTGPAQPGNPQTGPTQPAPVVPVVPQPSPIPPSQPQQPAPSWAPTPGIPASYTLQRGEFPFCIARRFNVNPQELLRINGLSSYSVYFAGEVLRIPQSGNGFPGNRALFPHPTTYIVRPGDTIFSVACIFGDVQPDGIIAVNGLTSPFRLTPGSTINIP